MNEAHVELTIHIERSAKNPQKYDVETRIDLPDGGVDVDTGGLFELDEKGLALDRLDLEEYGKRLYDDLFIGPVRDAYHKALSHAQTQSDGRLRVQLELDEDAPELQTIRWETLLPDDEEQLSPIAANIMTPFSRAAQKELTEPAEYPVKLLYAIANPADIEGWGLAKLDVEKEILNLLVLSNDLRRSGLVELYIMPGQSKDELPKKLLNQIASKLGEEAIISGPTSLDNLRKALLDQYHILHFLGHGRFRKSKRAETNVSGGDENGRQVAVRTDEDVYRAALFFESDQPDQHGAVDLIDGKAFSRTLEASADTLKLVFLASCETAREADDQHQDSPLAGLASLLVRQGIPAVIAMQDVIEIEAARRITTVFYRHLFLYGQVDRALNQARYQIHDQEEEGWSVPVLYLRHAELFKADPVRIVMEQIHRTSYLRYKPLPIEVAHLVGSQEAGSIDRYSDGSAATLGILDAIDSIFPEDESAEAEGQAKFALLIGRPGGAKTTMLQNISRHTVRNIQTLDSHKVVPVLVDLADYHTAFAGGGSRLEQMIFQNLIRYWPDLTLDELQERLQGRRGTSVFRLLFDGSSDMSSQHRYVVWDSVRDFARQYPRQQYVLTLNRRYYDSERLDMATDILIIQPLSRRRVEDYLLASGKPSNEVLCRELTNKHLFDLAASPWLLIKMIEQASRNIFPKSRAEVLQGVFQQMLAEQFPQNDNRREWAEESLYRLAYEMYQHRDRIWDEKQVFAIMAQVRQYRDYSLDELYTALVECGILNRTVPSNVRFSRRGLQAYCCAEAIARMSKEERDDVIDDVTASLGRQTRLRWWEPVLILLSGLVDDPNALLSSIDYGIDMTEGQQLFVMARCLLEIDARQVDSTIRDNVINALIWRLHGETERRVDRRARAANFLGQLGALSAADNLARIALGVDLPEGGDGDSPNWVPGTFQLEPNDIPGAGDSLVRLESAMALAELMSSHRSALKKIAGGYSDRYPVVAQLYEVLTLWIKKDVSKLRDLLDSDAHAGIRAVSSYALGDIDTVEADDLLIGAFLNAEKTKMPADLRWAVTESLTLLDSAKVTGRVILPLIEENPAGDQESAGKTVWKQKPVYPYLVYLIGRIRSQEDIILEFLDDCIHQNDDFPILLGAIKALGTLYAIEYQKAFIAIAKGEIPESVKISSDEPEKELWLRRVAIEALGHIGDQGCIRQLQKERDQWPPELERALYLATQEIGWRQDYQPTR